MDTKNIKVAFVTDDGTTISQHFGRARYYEVVTINNGLITHRERREKAGHHTLTGDEHRQQQPVSDHGVHVHGLDDASKEKHRMMASAIPDCPVVVARGMGQGAYEHLAAANIHAIITSHTTIDDAAKEIIDGTIVNYTQRLH